MKLMAAARWAAPPAMALQPASALCMLSFILVVIRAMHRYSHIQCMQQQHTNGVLR